MVTLLTATVGDGVGVGDGDGVAAAETETEGVAVGFEPSPLRPEETRTMTAIIMAATSIRPNIICHFAFDAALALAAVPLTVLGVPAGVLPDCCTRRVPQLGQRRCIAEY
jgi:hypothetical protein